MTIESDGEGRFREANHRVQDEERVGDGIVGGGIGSFRDDESMVYRIDEEDVKDGEGRMVHGQGVQQGPHQQQPQGSAVRWERFLHVPSIKVLLVENDDSTRHLVTALLRNGNYDVVEAANGLQAWKHLEDPNNHIDLILTEVVMPCLSGIGLLCKIMSHNTRKNIPVIMMSSHDSMALVFKCLSKGAVDFLVKPIRKNELRNLWQHIWRRCHSSSGSGSESGAQTQKSVKSKSSVKSDNNSSSNDRDDDRSDGSEDGSGTQSSWTKQDVEVDSSPAVSPWDQKSGSPDSTCALVIHSNAEVSGSNWVPMTATRESQEREEPLDNVAKGKELVKGEPRNFELQTESPFEVRIKLAGAEQNALSELNSTPNSKRLDKGLAQFSGEYPSNKHEAVIINMPDPPMGSKTIREPANVLEINNKSIDDSKELPDIELSLKRLREVEVTGETVRSDRNVLRRAELSAFSRYNTTSNASKAPNWITGSSSLIENSVEIVKKESVCDLQSHSTRNLLYPTSNGVSNNIDMGSITNKLSTNPVVFKSETTSTINGLHPSSAFLPMTNDLRCPPPQVILVKSDDMASTSMLAPPSGSHQELPIQHIHHHHHVHHFHNIGRQRLLPSHDDISLNKLATGSPHCGSSNMLGGPIENNPENDSLNRSASGSKHGSNNQNGSNTAVNAGGRNVESDVGLAGKSGGGDASGSGNIIDQNKFAHREAALTKFRQKRKERCFLKKVRYQNRKRLAEQRPRVQGQFVRQTGHEDSNSNADN